MYSYLVLYKVLFTQEKIYVLCVRYIVQGAKVDWKTKIKIGKCSQYNFVGSNNFMILYLVYLFLHVLIFIFTF